jgi:hypothetical protein
MDCFDAPCAMPPSAVCCVLCAVRSLVVVDHAGFFCISAA